MITHFFIFLSSAAAASEEVAPEQPAPFFFQKLPTELKAEGEEQAVPQSLSVLAEYFSAYLT